MIQTRPPVARTAVVVVGKGPAIVTTPELAADHDRLMLRADEPPYRTWAERRTS